MEQSATPENAPRFAMRGHYIKDLSFENPNAPQSLLGGEKQPKVDMGININATRLQENVFELAMEFNVRTSAEKTMFITELTYGGLFEVSGVEDEKVEQLIMVDCAFLLFPFARRVIADVTRDGGYPPLMLEPVDFYAMFVDRKNSEQS